MPNGTLRKICNWSWPAAEGGGLKNEGLQLSFHHITWPQLRLEKVPFRKEKNQVFQGSNNCEY